MFEAGRALDEFNPVVDAARLVLPAAAGREHLLEGQGPAAEVFVVPGQAAGCAEGGEQGGGEHAAGAEARAFRRRGEQGDLDSSAEII